MRKDCCLKIILQKISLWKITELPVMRCGCEAEETLDREMVNGLRETERTGTKRWIQEKKLI